MKKILLTALALCLVLCLSIPALAASMSPSASATTVAPGEDVAVTVTLDEKIERVITISYRVYFDPDLFTLADAVSGTSVTGVQTSGLKTDDKGTYVNVSVVDVGTTGITLEAGSFAVLTFTANADVTEATAEFEVVFENCMILDGEGNLSYPTHEAGGSVSVSIAPKAPETTPGETEPSTPSNPSTGDMRNPVFFAVLMVLSLSVLAVGMAIDKAKRKA